MLEESSSSKTPKTITMHVLRPILMGMICLLATMAACPTPVPSPTPDANAGDLPFAKLVTAPQHRTSLTFTGISISSSGPGARPPGYASYIAHPLAPTAPQIDTPYDLVTTNSLRDGTSLDMRITDVRQFALGKWQIGTMLDAYGFGGDQNTARYWGSAPSFLDNPVEQQHFMHAIIGPSSIVVLRPDTHMQITAGDIPSTWFSTITMATIPETNAGYSGGTIAPFVPPQLPQFGADLKLGVNQRLRFEANLLRLPQDAPYGTYAFGAHGDGQFGFLTLGIDTVQEWNSGNVAGLEELPTPVDWGGRHFVGPQRESMLEGATVFNSGVTKLEFDVAGSQYEPDTTHALFNAVARGMARRADLSTRFAETSVELYGISTDPTYDPFILNYPLFGDQLNSPWALPGPVYNSFYDLRDMTRYQSNQRTLGFIASRPLLGGTASATFTRGIQTHTTHMADDAQVGFIEPFYSFPFADGDGVLGTNASALLQMQKIPVGKGTLSATYGNYRYTHPTAETFPADNFGYGQQYVSLQPSYPWRDWNLVATVNLNRVYGAWFSPVTNLRIHQQQFALAGTKNVGTGALTLSASWWNYTDRDRPENFSSVMLWCRYAITLR